MDANLQAVNAESRDDKVKALIEAARQRAI